MRRDRCLAGRVCNNLRLTIRWPPAPTLKCFDSTILTGLGFRAGSLGFEVTKEKIKYKLVFHKGSFKKKVLKYGTPKPRSGVFQSHSLE